MNKGDRQGGLKSGFTIIETMIVLAVTGALFVAIAVTLNGRQTQAEFIHGIQDAQAQIQQVINQVSDGLYPSQSNFSCQKNLSGQIVIGSGTNSQQGTNSACVFLGSVIQFGVQDPSGLENYNVYTVAGLLGKTAGATSPFQNVNPTVTAASDGTVFAESTGTLEYGLTTCWISVNNAPDLCGNNSIGAIGFLMEPGDENFVNGNVSANPPVDIIPIPGTSLGQSQSNQTTAIHEIDAGLEDPNLTADAPINPTNGVQICLSNGANQSGLITIGGSGSPLLVKLAIKSDRTC